MVTYPRKPPVWALREDGGWLPVCPYCKKPYPDAAIFDVKNYPDDGMALLFMEYYPDDGMALLFMECESCHDEAQFTIEWKKLQPKSFVTVKIKSDD